MTLGDIGWGCVGLVVGYLAGSVPFGLLIAKARGIDLRHRGSCNIGATNVFRCVGKGWGVLALLLDTAKGFMAAFWLPMLVGGGVGGGEGLGLVFGAAAVAGHNWPIWLKGRGGKGVATSAGVLLGVAPWAMGIGLVVFAVTLGATRRVSAGSIAAAVAVAGSSWGFVYLGWMRWVSAVVLSVLAGVVIFRHRANILRLAGGVEPPLWGGG